MNSTPLRNTILTQENLSFNWALTSQTKSQQGTRTEEATSTFLDRKVIYMRMKPRNRGSLTIVVGVKLNKTLSGAEMEKYPYFDVSTLILMLFLNSILD